MGRPVLGFLVLDSAGKSAFDNPTGRLALAVWHWFCVSIEQASLAVAGWWVGGSGRGRRGSAVGGSDYGSIGMSVRGQSRVNIGGGRCAVAVSGRLDGRQGPVGSGWVGSGGVMVGIGHESSRQ